MDANELMAGFDAYVEDAAELHEVIATTEAPATSWPCVATFAAEC